MVCSGQECRGDGVIGCADDGGVAGFMVGLRREQAAPTCSTWLLMIKRMRGELRKGDPLLFALKFESGDINDPNPMLLLSPLRCRPVGGSLDVQCSSVAVSLNNSLTRYSKTLKRSRTTQKHLVM